MPTIIAISGNTGAGKTTLANALAKHLQATILSWDDFDEISTYPVDYIDWYHRGGNYDEWDYSALANILQELKNNHRIIHPIDKKILSPSEYIIFDAPLGRLHQQTGQYIDLCFHLAVPLDILLCRRIIRDFKAANKSKDELLNELQLYLSQARPLYFDDKLKETADIVINGIATIEEQLQQVCQCLNKHLF